MSVAAPVSALVAVVGRPNVGKSTLFNRLLGKRVAVVHDQAGTTRDRIYGEVAWNGQAFRLVDTGGLLPGEKEGMGKLILDQARPAVAEADLCLLVVDLGDGLLPSDREIASWLREQGKKVLVVMNKADSPGKELTSGEFSVLGFPAVPPVSALHGLGIGELLSAILERIPPGQPSAAPARTALAIVGRPNVGKSTLVNRLSRSERALVHDLPGTTRDPVDIAFDQDGRGFLLIDTAGLFRKAKHHSPLDRFALARTMETIARAEVVLLLMDPGEDPGRVDSSFIRTALEKGKGVVVAVNKWDVSGELTTKEYRRRLQEKLPYAGFIPVVFISALRRHGLDRLLDVCAYVAQERRKTVQTSLLNRVLARAEEQSPPPRRKGSRLKIYYAAQVKTEPPVFRVFVNNPALITANYRSYLLNCLRAAFGFEGVPLRLTMSRRARGR